MKLIETKESMNEMHAIYCPKMATDRASYNTHMYHARKYGIYNIFGKKTEAVCLWVHFEKVQDMNVLQTPKHSAGATVRTLRANLNPITHTLRSTECNKDMRAALNVPPVFFKAAS